MYALVQDVEIVRKPRLSDVSHVPDGQIVADSVSPSHTLRVETTVYIPSPLAIGPLRVRVI